jgi:hypothetical protein
MRHEVDTHRSFRIGRLLRERIQDTLALEYGEHLLAKYAVEWQPDNKHLLRVGNPCFYDQPHQSPHLEL